MNGDTIVDALRQQGTASDTPISLTNPGGNNPWLFTWPAGFAFNAGAPVVLTVPTVSANAVEVSALSGENDSQGIWTADGHMFNIRVCGNVAPVAVAKTFKVYIYAGNGLQNAAGAQADIQLAFGSAVLPAAGSASFYANWYLQAQCLWESKSLYMNGVVTGQIAGTLIGPTAFSIYNPSGWVAQQAAGAYNPLSFVVGVNLPSSASAVGDVVQLTEFTADRV